MYVHMSRNWRSAYLGLFYIKTKEGVTSYGIVYGVVSDWRGPVDGCFCGVHL